MDYLLGIFFSAGKGFNDTVVGHTCLAKSLRFKVLEKGNASFSVVGTCGDFDHQPYESLVRFDVNSRGLKEIYNINGLPRGRSIVTNTFLGFLPCNSC